MAMNGSSVLLYSEDVPGSGSYIVIGSQQDLTRDEKTAPIDVSSKDSRSQRNIPGRYSCTMKLSHLYVPSSSGMLALKSAMRNGTLIGVKVYEDGSPVEQASAVVSGRSESFPDQGGCTVSVDLTIDGEWTAL